jgi:serine-type D-Ala-D-Ala carboxypeptidase (penicillin-binding protein 5/6)
MATRRSLLLLTGGMIFAARAGDAVARGAKAAAHGKTAPGGHEVAVAAPAGSPAETPVGPLDTTARWAIVTDFNTGATLLTKNADDRMPPSSMTKLMTAYIVYGMLKEGRLKLDQQLPVSERAWRMQGSKMFVPIGSQIPVEDLIRGMIIQSGNDACIVLAEAISGSEQQFVELMNQKAQELGLTNSHFENCTGWPDPNHYMSCRDIATLASDLIRNFPDQYKYDSEKSFKYNNIEQENRNPLVQKGLADGLKTGHTDAGGFGIVASADRGGRRVILVLNGMGSMHERGEESERVLEWSFREWENVQLFAADETVESARVYLGASPTVPLVSGKPILATMPRSWKNTAQVSVAYNAPIPAPVKKGVEVGKLTLTGKGVPDTTVPLVAGADVPRMALPRRALAVVAHYIAGV